MVEHPAFINKDFQDKATATLTKITDIPGGRWMLNRVHPDLGGGLLYSLGNFQDRTSCIKINKSGAYLWNTELKKDGQWLKADSDEIREWSKQTLKNTKSKLVQKELHRDL